MAQYYCGERQQWLEQKFGSSLLFQNLPMLCQVLAPVWDLDLVMQGKQLWVYPSFKTKVGLGVGLGRFRGGLGLGFVLGLGLIELKC